MIPFLSISANKLKDYQTQYSLSEGKAFGLWYAVNSLTCPGFQDQIRAEEVVLAWQAALVAAELVKQELESAAQSTDMDRVAILKRGAKFFVLATMSIILHERNGKTFLNKLKAVVAVSKTTQARLKNYATTALRKWSKMPYQFYSLTDFAIAAGFTTIRNAGQAKRNQ
jgi:hypothetical protein